MKTVVIGASTNPSRYAWEAVSLLDKKGFSTLCAQHDAPISNNYLI